MDFFKNLNLLLAVVRSGYFEKMDSDYHKNNLYAEIARPLFITYLGVDNQGVRIRSVGDPKLGPIEDIVVLLLLSSSLHTAMGQLKINPSIKC